MGSAPKAPPAPDPVATASAQTASNIATGTSNSILNMVDQYTPDGRLTYKKIGQVKVPNGLGGTNNVPRFRATQTLSATQTALKGINDQSEMNVATIARDQSNRIGDLLGTNMSFDSSPEIQNAQFQQMGNQDYGAQRQEVEDALMARQQPGLDAQQNSLETRLANQGVRPGTAAYDAAMRNNGANVNDARMAAILGGGQEQSRLAGLDMARLGFNNQTQQQQYTNSFANRNQANQETQALRQAPINEISALLSQSQINNPNWVNTPTSNIAGTDYMGMVQSNYAQAMQKYQADQSAHGAMLGGVFGMAGTLGKAFMGMPPTPSDQRLKRDVTRIGSLENGLPWYAYNYVWDDEDEPTRYGLMAGDVYKVKPEAVVRMDNGYLAVHYDMVMGDLS